MDVDDTKTGADDVASKSLISPDFKKHSKSQIIPQRAALLKSILNFFKKAILDPSFSDSVRTGVYPISLFFSMFLFSRKWYFKGLFFQDILLSKRTIISRKF